MIAESFVFDSPTNPGSRGLKVVAKRYTMPGSVENKHGITLIYTHCIGSHKEQWEPILDRLFHLQNQPSKHPSLHIREAWGFDWQSHGDSALLNHDILKHQQECVSVYEWSPVIKQFLLSERMSGHRIVGLGHSAGAAGIILTTSPAIMPTTTTAMTLPYVSMILIEPTVINREVFNTQYDLRMAAMDFVVSATSQRKFLWKSKAQAEEYFKKRIPWKFWDERVVKLLVEYGLQSTPSGDVTLKCDRRHEALSYPDVDPHYEGAVRLTEICRSVPIHYIWGSRNDLVPEHFQESLANKSEGRYIASITKVEGGHFLVQEKPDRVADIIAGIIDDLREPPLVKRPKL